MAALDFPDNPATGDLYGSSGTVWRWDGARWASTAGASGARGRVAYAQTVADQGGFTTGLLNVAGLSVTYNGVAGRTYKITGWLMAKSPVAADIAQLVLAEGSGTALNASNWAMPLVNLAYRGVVHHVYTAASTASQTIKLMYAGGNNGHTVVASPTNPSFILVEDITYEAGTSGNPPGGKGSLVWSGDVLGTSSQPIAVGNIDLVMITPPTFDFATIVRATFDCGVRNSVAPNAQGTVEMVQGYSGLAAGPGASFTTVTSVAANWYVPVSVSSSWPVPAGGATWSKARVGMAAGYGGTATAVSRGTCQIWSSY